MSASYVPASLAASIHNQPMSTVVPPFQAEAPVYRQVITWLLFWPMLCLIARQAPYFAGAARTTAEYKGLDAASASSSHLYGYAMLVVQVAFVLAGRTKIRLALTNNPLIVAGIVLSFASALWSSYPIVSLQMSLGVGLCTLFACYVATRFAPEHVMRLLLFMGLASSLLSIFFVFALPSYGVFAGYGGGAWQGICDHKNTLAISMAFLLTPIFFAPHIKRSHRLLYSALLLLVICASQAKGGLLDTAGMLLFVFWLFLLRKARKQELALFVFGSLVAVMAISVLSFMYLGSIAVALGKDPSLSGRTGIYLEVLRSALKHPWLGYGFGAFWARTNPEVARIGLSIGWPEIGYSESGILEILLQLGVAGVLVILLMVGRGFFQGFRLLRSPFYRPRVGWFLSILFLALLTNLDAGWLMTVNTLDWLLIVIACIGLSQETIVSNRRSQGRA